MQPNTLSACVNFHAGLSLNIAMSYVAYSSISCPESWEQEDGKRKVHSKMFAVRTDTPILQTFAPGLGSDVPSQLCSISCTHWVLGLQLCSLWFIVLPTRKLCEAKMVSQGIVGSFKRTSIMSHNWMTYAPCLSPDKEFQGCFSMFSSLC